jgi:hypothetical protein
LLGKVVPQEGLEPPTYALRTLKIFNKINDLFGYLSGHVCANRAAASSKSLSATSVGNRWPYTSIVTMMLL